MRRRAESLALIVTVATAYGLNTLLKMGIGRERPAFEDWIDASGYSFPSGNAMVGAALYGMLAYLIMRESRSAAVRTAAAIVGTLLVLAVGWSRVYLGVHYLSDVIAGFVGGWICIAGAAIALGSKKSGAVRRTTPSFAERQ